MKNELDTVLKLFFKDVNDSEMYTLEQERELFRRYRNCGGCSYHYELENSNVKCPQCNAKRDMRAREAIVSSALRFVVKMAREYSKRYKGGNYPAELLKNLISAGNLGLLIAVDKFDATKSNRFLTYAPFWIKAKIHEELDLQTVIKFPQPPPKNKNTPVSIKDAKKNTIKTHKSVRETFVHYIDLTDETTANTFFHSYRERSMLAELDTSTDLNLDLIQVKVYEAMEALHLDLRSRFIVTNYYGVRREPKNIREIANYLGLSSERVRQLKDTALRNILIYFKENDLNAVWDFT